MSDTNKNSDDSLYESLLQDLGLELELDKPIGVSDEAVAAPESDEVVGETPASSMADTLMSMDDSGDEVFKIRDADQAPTPSDDQASYGEVELSPELINELKSVMGIGAASEELEEMSEDDASEQDVFKSSSTEMESLPETQMDADLELGMLPEAGDNPGVVEDPFLVSLPEDDETLSTVFDQEDEHTEDELSDADLASSLGVETEFDADLGDIADKTGSENEIPAETAADIDEPFFDEDVDLISVEDVQEDTEEDIYVAEVEEEIDFTNDSESELDAVEIQDFSSPLDMEHGLGASEEVESASDDAALNEPVFEDEIDQPVVSDPIEVDETLDFELSYLSDDGGDRLVPRISINAFCETVTTTKLMNASMADRRMANVSMEVIQGGVAKAIEVFQSQPMPHLIIVESTGKPKQILAQLDELALLCDENVKVVVVGAANDIRLYRELMNRGVSDYLVPPIEAVQLIRSISNLFVDPEQPFVGKTIAVTGVKGGVGSSTIAHNLAFSLAERVGAATTLVDLDLNFGTTGLDFNNETQQTIADALTAPDRFDEAVLGRLTSQATEKLSLFTAPATLDRTYDLDPAIYDHVLGMVRQSVPFALLDLPHIWSDWFKGTVVSADEIVVVAQPDLASLRNGKNLIDFLKAARPNDEEPRLVLNNVGVPKRPEIPVKDFAQAIGIEPSLVLPFDPQLFGTAANNGQMICEVAPESKCSQGVDYLASLVSGREIKASRSSLIDKLFKR